jgi:hypothetical protein
MNVAENGKRTSLLHHDTKYYGEKFYWTDPRCITLSCQSFMLLFYDIKLCLMLISILFYLPLNNQLYQNDTV